MTLSDMLIGMPYRVTAGNSFLEAARGDIVTLIDPGTLQIRRKDATICRAIHGREYRLFVEVDRAAALVRLTDLLRQVREVKALLEGGAE